MTRSNIKRRNKRVFTVVYYLNSGKIGNIEIISWAKELETIAIRKIIAKSNDIEDIDSIIIINILKTQKWDMEKKDEVV